MPALNGSWSAAPRLRRAERPQQQSSAAPGASQRPAVIRIRGQRIWRKTEAARDGPEAKHLGGGGGLALFFLPRCSAGFMLPD
jgi:hypothetical protein